MDEADTNIRLLANLAQCMQDKPDFMAYALALYKKTKNFDDQALCEKLGTLPEMFVRLALCKRPQKTSPDFADQVRELCDFTLIDEEALERIIEEADRLSESAWCRRKRAIRLRYELWSGLLAHMTHWTLAGAKAHRLIFAGVISALLIFSGSILLREQARRPPSSIAGNSAESVADRSESPHEAKSNSEPLPKYKPLPHKGASRARHSQVKSPKRQESIAQVSIDLEEYALLRQADVKERPINVPQSHVRLLLNMPEGSSSGPYTVKIVDAFGNPILSKRVANSDGKILRVILDTSGLQEKNYIFCISREGDIADCYRLIISGITRATRPDRVP